jgi:ribonuclease BN (tRNA processing enzyme)
LKLTILGSGTGVPSANRGGPGYLVQTGNLDLVMDLGMGTLAKLDRLGVSFKEFGPILISHLHPDHTAELVSLLFALRNLGIGRRKPLQIFGCHGLVRQMEKLQEIYGDWIRPGEYALEILEMGRDEVVLEDLRLSSIPVRHTEQSVGFRMEDTSGKVLSYSGDSDFCQGLIDLVNDADLALIESSFPDQMKCPGHLTPSEAGKTAREASAKRVVLTHFYPECEGVDLTAQCRQYFHGEVFLARDLIEFDI